MKRKLSALLAVVCCWVGLNLHAQNHSSSASWQKSGREDVFSGGTGSITLPFEMREGMVFVPLRINGSAPRAVVLDSGSSRMLIDGELAASLGLKVEEASSLQGAGSGRIAIRAVHDVNLSLPGLESKGYDFYATDLAPLSQTLKTKVDGIIGYDFLARFAVTIDFAAHRITIISPPSFRPDNRAEEIPLDIHDKWAFFRGELTMPGMVAVQDTFFIDSGSSDAVTHPVVKLMQSKTPTTTGVGFGKPVEGAAARAQSFRIGSFILMGPFVTCCGATEATSRMIGTEILRRFTVTFDYPNSRLFLRANAAFNEPFPDSP